MKRIATVMLSIAISIVLLDGCTTVSSSDKLAMESLCRMILAKPDTLLSMSSDTLIWFVNPHAITNKEQNDIPEKIAYTKQWFKANYTLDTTYLYINNYPFNYGKYTQRVKTKIFRVEYKSNASEEVKNATENRCLCFEFFRIKDKWLLNNIDIYSLKQLQEKFRFPWYEDSIDVE